MKLHNFHASSASFRVRIALALKGLPYAYIPVKLAWEGGENLGDAYRQRNPQALVPLLEDGEVRVHQSVAIIEYLDETHPEPPLLPRAPVERARVRALALSIACEIQPLNNLRVEKYLSGVLGQGDEALRAWRRHWIHEGFVALEALLSQSADTGRYCHGDDPSLADCCLVPQVYNSQRKTVALDLSAYPTLQRIYEACLAHPAIEAALPKHQPDHVELTRH
jgi:maleylpyruvate isomerase